MSNPCYLYLHGWASSPSSNKARYFQAQFAALGYDLQMPDFNQNDFYHLTLSRQLAQAAALLPASDQAVTVIGSSLGGLTALWLAEQQPQVTRLVLLAPALQFLPRCETLLGAAAMQRWAEQDELSIYHYAYARDCLLHYDFIRDMAQYPDAQLQRELPTLILHGQHDEVIDIAHSAAFAAARPWVTFQALDSDHGLNDVHAELWATIQPFCAL
jgi:pimeloyl-ACP methyl ester carboxylesterase